MACYFEMYLHKLTFISISLPEYLFAIYNIHIYFDFRKQKRVTSLNFNTIQCYDADYLVIITYISSQHTASMQLIQDTSNNNRVNKDI